MKLLRFFFRSRNPFRDRRPIPCTLLQEGDQVAVRIGLHFRQTWCRVVEVALDHCYVESVEEGARGKVYRVCYSYAKFYPRFVS
jgi:hypothetical protein